MKDSAKKIDQAMIKLFNAYERMKKKPRYYGECEELLYSSEIHIIELIGDYPEANTTELSERYGVSKGLISQMTSKLEKKGFIKKYQYIDNRKEIYYRLTDKGQKAHYGHIEHHKDRNIHIREKIENYSKEDIEFIHNFLIEYTDYLEHFDE